MKTLKILSYNIFWKAMTVKQNVCPLASTNSTICANNIVNFITKKKNDYDFICLQEASKKIVKKIYKNMNHKCIYVQSGLEGMATFYDTKYILDDDIPYIYGRLGSIGRPFIISFYNKEFCVINLHPDHKHDIYKFNKHLMNTIKYMHKNERNKIYQKLASYKIILAGDLNEEIKDPFIIQIKEHFSRKLYGSNINNKTCCNLSLDPHDNYKYAFDNILTSFGNIYTTILFHDLLISDHLPVHTTITY